MYLDNRHITVRTLTLLPAQAATSTSSSTSSTSVAASEATPTAFPHTAVQPVVPVPTPSNTPATSAAANTSHSSGVKKGPIIGGVIGGVIFVALCAFAIWYFCRGRKSRRMDALVRATSTTPMLRSHRKEKTSTDTSPDPDVEQVGEETQRGGVFGPFGGYHKTASREALEASRVPDCDDDDNDITNARIKDPEKQSLTAPPVSEHPALHPLPGHAADIPVYYPGGSLNPLYTRRNLPSQRSVHPKSISLPSILPPRPPFHDQLAAQGSPQIPDFIFSPIELVPNSAVSDTLDTVPITPQAELAAFPSPPQTIPSRLISIAQRLHRVETPPRNSNKPRRQSTPPRLSAPLDRLTPAPHSTTAEFPPTSLKSIKRDSDPMKSFTGLQISGLQRKPTGRPELLGQRARGTTFPSPTAGGRPELPASIPRSRPKLPSNMPSLQSIQNTPRHMISSKQPMPAFNHISLPSPDSPNSTLGRSNTTYSIPIGLDPKSRRQSKSNETNWPLTTHPVTSDKHHLREMPSAVSALTEARDAQNASAVSALSALNVAPTTPGGGLKHNHSREFTNDEEPDHHRHVMSWQDYEGNSDMNQRLIDGDSERSPMVTPSGDMQPVVSPMTMGAKTPGIGGYGTPYQYGVVSPMTIGTKTPSQQSLDEREREREEYFGDLSVQPLNMGQRIMGKWGTRKSARRNGSHGSNKGC